MRSKCINFTSGSKSVTGNWLRDIDFLYNVESFAVHAAFVYFGDFALRVRSHDHITTSDLKSDVIFEFSAPIFL